MSDTAGHASEAGSDKRQVSEAEKKAAARLEEMFGALDKVIRGMKLYKGEGSVVERQLDDLAQKTDAAVKGAPVTLRLAPFGLVHGGLPVTPTDKRVPYLFQLFCDGVRELTVKPGIGREELRALVKVLGSDIRSSDDDLVTLLWKANLKHVSYYAVDALAADDGGVAADSTLAAGEIDSRLEKGTGGAELALSSDDIRMLRTEDLLDWVREARAPAKPAEAERSLTEQLRQRYQSQVDFGRFMDIAVRAGGLRAGEDGAENPMVVGVFESLIAAGNAAGVVAILEHLAAGGDEVDVVIKALRHELLGPERLVHLAPLVQSHLDDLAPSLEKVAPLARKGLVALLTELQGGTAEARIQAILAGIGVDLTPYYLKRLEHKDEKVVLGAIAALGRIGSEDAVQALGNALSSTLTSVRRAALEAMVGRYHEAARVALSRVLRDPDKECRMLAFRILAGSGDSRVAWALLSYAQKPAFEKSDADEQEAVYKALASFRDARMIGHFTAALGERNLTRSKTVTQRQLMAVEALRMMGSAEAREALESFKGRWYLPAPVKDAISSSLSRWSAS